MSGPNGGPLRSRLTPTLLAVGLAALGGLVAQGLGLPAAWLMGSALTVAIAAVCGVPVAVPAWLRDVALVLAGVSMGATVARDSLSLIAQWPVTLMAMVIELVLIVAATGYMLQRLFGHDRGTAYLSSFPGHLTFIMGIAAAGLGDARQIAIIQVIRVLMLTIFAPLAALFMTVAPAAGAPVAPMAWPVLAAVTAGCALVGFLFEKLRVPAGYALGAMAAATAAKLGGLFEGSLPAPVLAITFILIGALVGSRFAGIRPSELRRAATGGLIATLMTIAIVTVISFLAAGLVDMPVGQIWLGLAPGAIEVMGPLGITLGFDTGFIVAHHVFRLLLLSIGIPLIALLVRERPGRP